MDFILNGKSVQIESEPGEMLADLLRVRLGMTGTKIGCNESECGSCTVLIDDAPILSCSYPAARVSGREIRTIEGLNQDGKLHPIQEAFIKQGAVQCGFCIPGQIMTAVSLVEKNPDPNEDEIQKASRIRSVAALGILRSSPLFRMAHELYAPANHYKKFLLWKLIPQRRSVISSLVQILGRR